MLPAHYCYNLFFLHYYHLQVTIRKDFRIFDNFGKKDFRIFDIFGKKNFRGMKKL